MTRYTYGGIHSHLRQLIDFQFQLMSIDNHELKYKNNFPIIGNINIFILIKVVFFTALLLFSTWSYLFTSY